jgi:hypothetical protein
MEGAKRRKEAAVSDVFCDSAIMAQLMKMLLRDLAKRYVPNQMKSL